MMRFVIFLTSLIILQASAKTKLKDLIPLCSKSDPKFYDCVKASGQLYIDEMVKGIKDFGLPTIDPLKIPFLELSQSDKPVGLKLNMSDTTHSGLKGIQLQNIKLDNDKDHLEVDMLIPRYQIDGVCDLGGRILLLPITGHGPCTLASIDFQVRLTMDGEKETRGGKIYVKSKKYQVKIKFTKGEFKLTGLFGGNKELGATMNRFLNENALEVLNEMKAVLEDVWSQIFGGIIDKLIKNVPNDELFLP